MKKQKKFSYRMILIIIFSILLIILTTIAMFQIIEITPNEGNNTNEETNDYDTEHKYDDMYFETYSKDEVLAAYQEAKNAIDVNQLQSVSEHIELISMMVIKTMNIKQEEISSIDDETQVSIMNLAILGYQVKGIGLEPLKLLFGGKYETLVNEAIEKGFVYPEPIPEENNTTETN